jgi:hypothetical protein
MFGITSPPAIASQPSPPVERSNRLALGLGFHAEVTLAPPGLGWIGVADAIKIAPGTCEIIDYKTGEEDPGHFEQLRIYALLWARDSEVNPEGRTATDLTVVYPGSARFVPAPSGAELDELENVLRSRSNLARAAVQHQPPRAQVSAANCRFCDVKQLCGVYWTTEGQESARNGTAAPVRSLQVEILEQLGVRAWRVAVELDPLLESGTLALLVAQEAMTWERGARLRLLDVHLEEPAEDQLHIIHLGSSAEAYLL